MGSCVGEWGHFQVCMVNFTHNFFKRSKTKWPKFLNKSPVTIVPAKQVHKYMFRRHRKSILSITNRSCTDQWGPTMLTQSMLHVTLLQSHTTAFVLSHNTVQLHCVLSYNTVQLPCFLTHNYVLFSHTLWYVLTHKLLHVHAGFRRLCLREHCHTHAIE